MLNKKKIFASLVGFSIFFAASPKAFAEKSVEMPVSQQNVQFRRIEQPLGLKAAVTLGGVGLIGLELWWFIFSK